MNREELYKLAREAGFTNPSPWSIVEVPSGMESSLFVRDIVNSFWNNLERFADLLESKKQAAGKSNTGGFAFPAMHFDLADVEHGMTLRDYFAAAMVSSGHIFRDGTGVWTPEHVARQAYQLADAMVEARK